MTRPRHPVFALRVGAPTLLLSLLLCAAGSLAEAPPLAASAPDLWQERSRLLDVRYENAVDLSRPLASGLVEMSLAQPVIVEGRRWDSLLIGHGWVRFQALGNGDAAGEPTPGEPRPASPELGPRLDVLAGEGVRQFGGTVPWITTSEGSALRWTALRLPGGGEATAELVIDRQGHVTAQYLRLPREAELALRRGELRAGTSGAASSRGLLPKAASSFTLMQPVLSLRPPLVPGGPMRPMADGPPPMGCDPPAGTWCEQADGPDTSIILVSDVFDDQASQGRGWTATGLWHESTWPVCPGGTVGGASANPGAAWYAGVDGTCAYQDNMADTLQSPMSVDAVTNDTVMEFMSRISKEEPFETAEILFNGVVIGTIDSSTLDPNALVQLPARERERMRDGFLRALRRRATLQVGFRFTSDDSRVDLPRLVHRRRQDLGSRSWRIRTASSPRRARPS